MKKWLKFFGLGFFNDNIAKDGANRGLWNFLISLILAFILLGCSMSLGDSLPFKTHYKNSQGFKSVVRNAIASENALDITVENGKIKVAKGDNDFSKGIKVDTFKSQADSDIYSKNGYGLVVDTRPSNSLANYYAYCVAIDGSQTEISYEEYLSLAPSAKYNFEFRLKYLCEEKVLTDLDTESYKTYLLGIESAKASLDKINGAFSSGEIDVNEYRLQIYSLYFENYYPSISNYESVSKVPLLRNYYYHEYINGKNAKVLILFDDSLIGSFETERGINVAFYGLYNGLGDGNIEKTESGADAFIFSAYSSLIDMSGYIYFMNILRLIPFIAIMPIVVALIVNSILNLKGIKTLPTFSSVLKTVGSFTHYSALFAGIISVILAFFVQKNLITMLPIIAFFVVLMLRAVILIIREIVALNKSEEAQEMEKEN